MTNKRRISNNPLWEQAKTLFLQRKPKRNTYFWTCQLKSLSASKGWNTDHGADHSYFSICYSLAKFKHSFSSHLYTDILIVNKRKRKAIRLPVRKPLHWICKSFFANLQAVQCKVFWRQSCLMKRFTSVRRHENNRS